MNQIKFICSIFLKNKINDYLFYTIIIFSFFFAIFLILASMLFIGEKYKVFIDLGVAGINLILLLSIAYFSSECLPEIRKNKFIYWILSLPVKKYEIFIGAFFYIVLISSIIAVIYISIYTFIFLILKIKLSCVMFLYFLLFLEKIWLIGVIGLLISIFYNTYTTILSVFSIYFIGSYTYNFLQYIIKKGYVKLVIYAKILYFIFPDMQLPDLTAKITHNVNPEISLIFYSLFYYFTFIIVVLIIGSFVFNKKEI